MADVFISYSRDDRDRVETIASALEAEGLSVWWDPEIRPGETFDDVIQQEIDRAKCVVVVWSEKSTQSKWVRSEASEADDRNIIVPTRIDNARIPIAFKLIQTEDFSSWNGDRNADCWQRVMLQVGALTSKDVVGFEPSTQQSGAHWKSLLGAGGLALVVLGLLGFAWWYGPETDRYILASAGGLALLALSLFRIADKDLNPALKAIARQWFLPVEGTVRVNTIEAFNNMFESFFGRAHFSIKCVQNSTNASTIALIIIFLISFLLTQASPLDTVDTTTLNKLVPPIVLIALVNIFGDYISLLETRVLLRLSAKHQKLLVPALLLDAVLTPIIFAFFFAFIPVIIGAVLFGDFQAVEIIFGTFLSLLNILALNPYSVAETRLDENLVLAIRAGFATAYITSIWLWLALIFGPIVRFFVWSRHTGLTAVGRILDTQNKPFTALGYVTALLILLIGLGAWGTSQAVAMWS